ncbi:MAG: M14 family zinc carboxypeptidase [Acidobacteriota bacterium]
MRVRAVRHALFLTALLPVVIGAPALLTASISMETAVDRVLGATSDAAAQTALEELRADPAWEALSRPRFDELEEMIAARGPVAPPADGVRLEEIAVATAGGTIPVLVRLPGDYTTARSWPLLLALHGGPPRSEEQARRGARRMMEVWAPSTDRQGWMVAAPVMRTTVSVDAFTQDRLPYEIFHPEQAEAVIRALSRRYAVDRDRVVATGISLGSNFSIAFAASRPDLFAAIVPVSTEGESRERLIRDLVGVPIYLLEGTEDANILTITGPRALRDTLRDLGGEIVYREFAGRAHEGFSEHYDDVLRWLARHPRRRDPRTVLRVPHDGIVPVARRVHWVESDTRQGLVRARVTGPTGISIDAWHATRLTLLLDDDLLDLDRPITVRVNGELVHDGMIPRSIATALAGFRRTGDPHLVAARLTVEVPVNRGSLAAGRRLAREVTPTHAPGRLSYWETFAAAALRERFPGIGFDAVEVDRPAGEEVLDGVALRVTDVDPRAEVARAGLQVGDVLLDVNGEPFFAGGGVKALTERTRRDLRGALRTVDLRVRRQEATLTLSANLGLGPYTHTTPPPAASPRAAPPLAFDHYHRVDEIEALLASIVARHSDLARLVEIGRSRANRPILAVEINNPVTGPAGDKPGFYLDGNIHGGEILGGEGALYFVNHLLTTYGQDEEITRLVDRLAFYVVCVVNPDGRVISVETPENHRWNLRPVDEDGDGRFDEDPPEDLDGDGAILTMRVADADGDWMISPDDPRLMVHRRRPAPVAGDAESVSGHGRGGSGDAGGPFYRLLTEGIDNDGDGAFNEDRIGGVDLNRNFPANWHPAQFASGPYPLSEPESRALVDYITAHPSIAAIHTYHTSGGMLLRFPTLADQDWDFPAADLEDYREIAAAGVPLTGYDNYAFSKKKIVDLMHPGHGVFNDWGSSVFGVLTMTTEMWKHPLDEGEASLLAWNDRVLGGAGFIAWHVWQHPQLGPVELGGWDRFTVSNPPEDRIEDEVERNNRWVLSFAQRLPQVRILEAAASLPGGRHGHVRIEATVANTGWMPTATAYATDVLETAHPVEVRLSTAGLEVVAGDAVADLGVLPGTHGGKPEPHRLSWELACPSAAASLAPGATPWAEITVSSEKAGTVRQRVDLAAETRQACHAAPAVGRHRPATGRAFTGIAGSVSAARP